MDSDTAPEGQTAPPSRDCSSADESDRSLEAPVSSLERLKNWVSEYKDSLGFLKDLATVLALVIGAIWSYALTREFRDTAPRMTIKQKVNSWRLKDGSLLVRVDAELSNSGKVQIAGIQGKMIVVRLLPETDTQAAEYAHGRIFFSCKDQSGRTYPDCIPEKGLNATSQQAYEINEISRSLEPGESEFCWRYWHLDNASRVVEVATFIDLPGESAQAWMADSTYELTPGALAETPR